MSSIRIFYLSVCLISSLMVLSQRLELWDLIRIAYISGWSFISNFNLICLLLEDLWTLNAYVKAYKFNHQSGGTTHPVGSKQIHKKKYFCNKKFQCAISSIKIWVYYCNTLSREIMKLVGFVGVNYGWFYCADLFHLFFHLLFKNHVF